MKFKRILIPLTDSNTTVIPLHRPSQSETDALTTSETARQDPQPETVISSSPANVSGFTISRYFHPACAVNLNIPDADLPLVRTWLGATTSQTLTPGDTLIKRMTDAAIGTFKTYLDRAAQQNLFTSPFLIGHALRRADGSHCNISQFTKKLINTRAPQLVVHEAALDADFLLTVTEIYNTPVRLSLDVRPFEIDPQLLPAVTHLDIYAGKPVSLLDGHEQVTAIRTAQIAGENMKIWHYNRLAEDIVLSNLAASKDFRIIASIPIATAMKGVTDMKLPQESMNIYNWNTLAKLDCDTLPGDIDNPQENYEYKQMVTSFLDLGMPGYEKKVRGVTAHGIFPRGLPCATDESGRDGKEEEITMELLGSHHRDIWHTVARSRGPHIRILRACAYRWWQVRVTLPRDGLLDTLTFETV